MQAPSGLQRLPQRRSPVSDQNPPSSMPPPPTPPTGPPSQSSSNSGIRSSSGSGKSAAKRSKDPSTQLSQIEKSVTHLLIATKQLLETLTQWSRHTATEGEVSDVYVRLGYEFNIACRAFTSIGVATDDLGPVPDLLRGILEETLSQEASPASLDKFLPRIRDIIINLLHGLKKKQSKLRATKTKDGVPLANGQATRQASVMSSGSGDSSLNQVFEEQQAGPYSRPAQRSLERRTGSGSGIGGVVEPTAPARAGSIQSSITAVQDESPYREDSPARWEARAGRQPQSTYSDSSMTSSAAQNMPVMTPEDQKPPPIQRISLHEDTPPHPPPPPPPPKEQDAMALLQRGGELERRASRRYSAYQISKHLGASPGGVPMLPPAQNSPIPNRGRDVRESLNAVRTRGSNLPSRQKSYRINESSPSRGTRVSRRISEEGSASNRSSFKPVQEQIHEDSPISKTPEDKLGPAWTDSKGEEAPALSGTVTGPPADTLPQFPMPTPRAREREPGKVQDQTPVYTSARQPLEETAANEEFIPEDSPQPGTELTLFLQYKSKIKKFVLPEGSNELSMARLQLAFIEKFAWNTHNNGNDLPEIYIQDPVSGVRHELEDLSDVKDRSVLVLNIEPLDEVKRHFDEGLGGLRKTMEGLRLAVDGQQASIARVSEKQQVAANEIARISLAPPPAQPVQVNGIKAIAPVSNESLQEVQTLRRDLAIMRQTFSSFTTSVNSSVTAIRAKADTVKAKSIDAAIPVLEGDTGRSYVNAGKKTVGDESESIVNRVDDLQDIVEDLRKDVVTRGVRPLPRQLETVNKDISDATKELKKMQEYVKHEKPTWTKIWEKELELVCNDREFLTLQEELIADLEDDLDKATQTMLLVEQATKQQNLQAATPGQGSLRSTSRGLPNIDTSDVDPMKAKDGVLGEVRALQPNHESRLEAIERAEKNRQRELQDRLENAAFRKELSNFVEEGKLKKSGGVDEIERLRRLKDEEALKGEHEAIQIVKAARKKAREEEKARQAAEEAHAAANGDAFDGGADGAMDDGPGEGEAGGVAAEAPQLEPGEGLRF